MICGGKLEYLEIGKEFTCIKCNKKEVGYVYCAEGHYVCDDCHGETQFEEVLKLALTAKSTNPLVNAEIMLKRGALPMLGCEHAWVAAGALLSAIRNTGTVEVTEEQIREALTRTRRQAIGAYCGLTGVCGIAPAIGAAFSVLLGAACPKDRETAATMGVVGKTIIAIANETGPCCCKNFLRTSLSLACKLAEEYLDVKLDDDRKITCMDHHRHPHGCREVKCNYYKRK